MNDACKHGNRHYCGHCLGETGEGSVPPPSPSREDLAALREADQATIASLGLVNKSLADALEAVRPYLLKRFEAIENEARAHGDTPVWRHAVSKAVEVINATDSALRSAGRLQPPQG